MPKSYNSAVMHETMFSPGVGELKKELAVTGDAGHKAVEAIILAEGSLVVAVTVKDKVGKSVTLDIPLSNFKLLRE